MSIEIAFATRTYRNTHDANLQSVLKLMQMQQPNSIGNMEMDGIRHES